MSKTDYRLVGLGDIDPTAPLGSPRNPLHAVLTVPNFITFLRLIFTVIFVFLYPNDRYHSISIILFIAAACTDWIDGKLARKLQQVSWFGKRFDPVMDRVLIFSGLISLLITSRIPVWIFAFLLVRDAWLFCGGSIVMSRSGRIPDVCLVGKACTFILMTGFAMLLLDLFPIAGLGIAQSSALPGFNAMSVSFGIWLVYIGCILSFIAATVYTVRGVRILRSSHNDKVVDVR